MPINQEQFDHYINICEVSRLDEVSSEEYFVHLRSYYQKVYTWLLSILNQLTSEMPDCRSSHSIGPAVQNTILQMIDGAVQEVSVFINGIAEYNFHVEQIRIQHGLLKSTDQHPISLDDKDKEKLLKMHDDLYVRSNTLKIDNIIHILKTIRHVCIVNKEEIHIEPRFNNYMY